MSENISRSMDIVAWFKMNADDDDDDDSFLEYGWILVLHNIESLTDPVPCPVRTEPLSA